MLSHAQKISDGIQRAEVVTDENIWQAHRELAGFNHNRLNPHFPHAEWKSVIEQDVAGLMLEGEVLEWERQQIMPQASSAPVNDPEKFMAWFEELLNVGPGQNDPLFDWLAKDATIDQMRWFIQQEVAGEAGFEDLTAMTQLKLPTQPKLELARNYWDEMGRGRELGMHGPMLEKVAKELGLAPSEDLDAVAIESLALANVMLGVAMNRRYAYHSVGALGVIELTAPARARKVYEGLKRLGMSAEGQRYYLLHSTLDIKHSEAWNEEAIKPLVTGAPEIAAAIAEGALMRLNAGKRCFDRYRKELWLN